MNNSSVLSTIVNSTNSVPISTKNQDNDQNESNHSSSNLKDIELVLNASKNHKVKQGHGISDSLPGIRKNRYGYVKDDSSFVGICWLAIVQNEWILPELNR